MRKKAIKNLLSEGEALARNSSALSLDPKSESASASLVLFLRLYRGRNGDVAPLQAVLPNQEFTTRLEGLRCAIRAGDFGKAELLMEKLKPETPIESIELQMEKLRWLVHLDGRFDEGLELSEKLLQDAALSEISRMSCLQIRSHALIHLGRTMEAVTELRKASALAEIYNLAGSAFSIFGFLVQAHAELGNRKEAEDTLNSLQALLQTIEADELWLAHLLTVIRSEFHFLKTFSRREDAALALMEARAIACHLEDRLSVGACDSDLEKLGIDGARLQEKVVRTFEGWTFLPRRDLILTRQSIRRLQDHPQAKAILLLLSHGPVTNQELFQSIWKLKFDSERHGTFLRAALSKLRKLLPTGALLVSESKVFLK